MSANKKIMVLEDKISQVLLAIIEEYIETAQPVGSLELAEKYEIDLSSATIRNYMSHLEEEGYLCQPHISSGRIPTESAYQFYSENYNHDFEALPKSTRSRVQNFMTRWRGEDLIGDREIFLKATAKMLAEVSGDLAMVEFKPNDVYYTGLAYLFEQPEFEENQIVVSTGRFIDRVDEMLDQLRNLCTNDIEVFIGKENPIDRQFSVILGRYRFGNENAEGMLGLIGPLRMPYARNVALMRLVQKQLSQIF